ncbi:MAG: hypothetical protein ABXS92_06150 [Sulfurimonas sp.]
MKTVIDYLQGKNLIFKSFKAVMPKALGSRKRVEIYLGVDLKSYYSIVIRIEKKSRILRKEAGELMLLHEKLESYTDAKIKKKYMIVKAPLCSKAKKLLEEHGWKVFVASQQSEE